MHSFNTNQPVERGHPSIKDKILFTNGEEFHCIRVICIGYTPRARLLTSDLATECHRNEVAKSLGNQARGVQPACTMTIQNFKKSG